MLLPAAEVLPRPEILERIRHPEYDPLQKVYLESATALQPDAPANWQHEVISIPYPSPNEAVVHVRTSAPGYLRLADVYYPGWRAWVNGEERPVLVADTIFRAVPIPAGEHTVRFAFTPRYWEIGIAVSEATWLLGLATGVWWLQCDRRLTQSER